MIFNPQHSKKPSLVLLSLLLGVVFFSSLSSALNDAVYEVDFEQFPSAYITTDNGDSMGLIITDYTVSASTNSKINDWSFYTTDSSTYYAYNTSGLAAPSTINESSGVSVSFWVFPYSDGQAYNYSVFSIFQDGGTSGISGGIHQNGSIHIYGGNSNTCSNGGTTWTHGVITNNTWNHIVANVQDNAGADIWINGVQQNTSDFGVDDYYMSLSTHNNHYFGRSVACDWTSSTAPGNPITNAQGVFYLDDFLVYDYNLTSANVASLYAGGAGYSPYSNQTPEQVASISPFTLTQQSNEARELGQFYNYETYAYINFTYNSASYGANENNSANTGDFAVEFTDALTIKFYSFAADVQTIPITLNMCNANGCVQSILYFSVGSVAGGGFQQIATISDLLIDQGETKTRYFTDYFTEIGDTALYFSYYGLDGTFNSLGDGSDSNISSCLNVDVDGIIVAFTGLNTSCTLIAYFIGVDDAGQTTSNAFRITNTAVIDSPTGDPNSLANKLYGFIPDPENLTTQQKFIWVVVFFLIIIAGGALIIMEGGGSSAIFIPAISLALIMVFLLFTVLGFIPAWIAVILVLGLVFYGIAKIRGLVGGY